MQTSTEAPAHVIGDLWVVDQQLGSGGMGAVYRCHNKDAPRVIAAIKVLEPALQHHPEARARFQREAELLAILRHPGIVRVFNAQLDATPPFIQMELVEGCALESLLMGGAMKTEVAHDLLRQLLSALSYLHGEGVYHRDLKPQNLLVADGRLKVIDFGLAAEPAGDRLTHHDARFGTISYCPPEWMNGDTDPEAWDLYAAGVIAYEMLTGSVAFPVSPEASAAQQMVKTMASKQELPFLDPGEHVPPALRTLVCALTARDPRARPATATDALRDLGGWTPLSTFNTRRAPAKRRLWPLLAGIILSFGVLVALFAVVAIFFQLRPVASPEGAAFTLPPLQTIDVGVLESAARDETSYRSQVSPPRPSKLEVPPTAAPLPTTSPPPMKAPRPPPNPPRRRGLFNRKKTPQ